MFKYSFTLLSFILIFALHTSTKGQGCSDAGICTSGLMNEDANSSPAQGAVHLNMGYHFAQGDDGTTINALMLQADYLVGKASSIQIKVPYLFTNGKLGKTNGLGDLSLSFNGLIKQAGEHRFAAFLGARISMGKADRLESGKPLPMVYQTNLGTTDLLLGAKWTYKGWAASLGYQQPLIQNNENGFLQSLWEDQDKVSAYTDSRKIERRADLVARIEKTFQPGRFAFTGGFVPIYHLGEDSYVNEENMRIDIDGSDGLTLNIALSAAYKASQALSFNIFYGSPLITRDVQPAGLARTYAAGISVAWRL
jgi:hypothetical protein